MNSEMVQPTQGDEAMAYRIVSDFRVGGWPAKEGEVARLIAQVRLDGMAAGREEAAKVCDIYAEVNFETAGDAVLLDPVLRGQGFTPENVEQSQQHQTDMLIHTSYFHAGQHLASAIRALGGNTCSGE